MKLECLQRRCRLDASCSVSSAGIQEPSVIGGRKGGREGRGREGGRGRGREGGREGGREEGRRRRVGVREGGREGGRKSSYSLSKVSYHLAHLINVLQCCEVIYHLRSLQSLQVSPGR